MEAKLDDAKRAIMFALAGNATLTIRSAKTGKRFTYRLRQSEDKRLHFVGLLSGPDNESHYSYLGLIRNLGFEHGRKSRISRDAPGFKAFAWAWQQLRRGAIPDVLEVWHAGKCGRCGRKLTVPESVNSGFGPECIKIVGGSYV